MEKNLPMFKLFSFCLLFLLFFSMRANLLKDGRFVSTNQSFFSDLNRSHDCSSGPGTFCLDGKGWKSDDLSNPSNNVLKIDGFLSPEADNIIWSQTVNNVVAGNYEFEFWTRLRTSEHNIGLEIRLNGVLHDTYLSNSSGVWNKALFHFNMNNSASVLKIEIVQKVFGHYTDFDFDEMSLKLFSNFAFNGPSTAVAISGISDTITTYPQVLDPPSIAIHFYPNPIVDYATVEADSGFGNYSLLLFSLDGKIVGNYENIAERKFKIYLGNLPKSSYFYRVYTKKQILKNGKFLVF